MVTVTALRAEKARLLTRLQLIDDYFSSLAALEGNEESAAPAASSSAVKTTGKHTMSAADRGKLSALQKKRWAEKKAGKGSTAKAKTGKKKAKPVVSKRETHRLGKLRRRLAGLLRTKGDKKKIALTKIQIEALAARHKKLKHEAKMRRNLS